MEAKLKRVVVHDGTGHSFWLAPNREPEKLAAAMVDWVFTVWQPASWERLRKLPADLNPTELADTSPPSQIDVFTTGVGGQPNNPAYGSSYTLLFGAVEAMLSVVSFGRSSGTFPGR